MYGFGNWAEVAEHVGTKSKSQCIDHYNTIYVNSPCFPLPVCSYRSQDFATHVTMSHSSNIVKFFMNCWLRTCLM